MSRKLTLIFRQFVMVLLLVGSISLGPAGQVTAQPTPLATKIAYVFRSNDVEAGVFKSFLETSLPGDAVTLVPIGSVLGTDFAVFNMIIIADDTGVLNDWGTSPDWPNQVIKVRAPNVPILGLGEGGYAFFGKLGLWVGWPHGWHGPQDRLNRASTTYDTNIFNGLGLDPIIHYNQPVNSVGIYKVGAPADVNLVGLEEPTTDHAPLIFQGCRFLWGGSGGPGLMTGDGKKLFLNYVAYITAFQCAPVTTPPPACFSVTKSSSPLDGIAVAPGDVITYTLSYTISNDPACNIAKGGNLLIDSIPPDTTFVPGSASGGITPDASGQLIWAVYPADAPKIKQFQVIVSPNQCVDQKTVHNQASMEFVGFTPQVSNPVSHPVTCPSISLPNEGPFYAEDEIEVHPYPLAVGATTSISARLNNPSAVAQPVTVQFQVSPGLGIGLTYTTVATRTALLPAGSTAVVSANFSPTFSGQTSFQVVVTGPGLNAPLVTQSNLDVSEDFVAGSPDTLTFPVRNSTTAVTDILLVVNNTCPGWTAAITDPASGIMSAMGIGEVRPAKLTVTPPSGSTLGSGCSIDVEAWDATTHRLIGGIRKLDVPPVHLPPHVNPAWEEPEIVVLPDPPVVGVPGKICVELSNPTSSIKTVTVVFSVADFGAGIGFTPVVTKSFDLPPNSFGRYCADWTPAGGGTLHKCILVTLQQKNFRDMRSQRNVDIVHRTVPDLTTFDLPFNVGSPDGLQHHVSFHLNTVGIDPYWMPHILPVPPPDVMRGQELTFHLGFGPSPTALSLNAAPPAGFQFGNVSQVEVTVLLDGVAVSGFTVQVDAPHVFLPLIGPH